MNALVKFAEVYAFELDVSHEEPTVLDVTLGATLGYDRPRKIRELIERNIADFPGIRQAPHLGRLENAGNLPDTYTVDVYHLNEEQAMYLMALVETPKSRAMLREFISITVKMRKALIERALTPALMTPEQIATHAATVAVETVRRIQIEQRRGKWRAKAERRQEAQLLLCGTGEAKPLRPAKPLGADDTEMISRVLAAVERHEVDSFNGIRGSVRGKHHRVDSAIRALLADGRVTRDEKGIFRSTRAS